MVSASAGVEMMKLVMSTHMILASATRKSPGLGDQSYSIRICAFSAAHWT